MRAGSEAWSSAKHWKIQLRSCSFGSSKRSSAWERKTQWRRLFLQPLKKNRKEKTLLFIITLPLGNIMYGLWLYPNRELWIVDTIDIWWHLKWEILRVMLIFHHIFLSVAIYIDSLFFQILVIFPENEKFQTGYALKRNICLS